MTTRHVVARSLRAVPRRAGSVATRKELSTLVPLDDEFPGLPRLSPEVAKATSTSVSTLPNGLTIITEDACTTSTVTMTFPKAGSGNEMLDEPGAALINKNMNFRSGSGISTIMINRTIEDAGGVPFTSVDRRGAKLGYTVTPDKAVGLLPLLATDCAFEKWDVRDAKKLAATEKEAASGSASIVLTESLYAAAYGPQSPAGRTLYSANLPTDSIKSFRARTYGLNGAVLAATGVQDHAAFCREAEALLSSAPTGDSEKPAAITYLGGETRLDAPFSGYAHVTMGFEAPVSSVVASVVEQYLNLAGMPAGVSGFSTAGLVGVYAGSDSPGSLVDAMIGVVASSVDPALVKRAKTLAKAEALLALDDGSKSLANAMTAAVLESNIFTGPADVAASFDKVTDAQVTEALAAMRKSNPSVAAVGDIAAVPYHATVAAALK